MKSKRHHPFSRGFTLTELLVVIFIVAVLAAISLVFLRRMRAMADKTGAIKTLSQLQVANISYSTDNNGIYLPNLYNDDKGTLAARWFQIPDFLVAFRGEMPDKNGEPSLDIPQSYLDPKVVRAKERMWDKIYSSFGQNVNGLGATSKDPDYSKHYTVSSVRYPERSMAFASATDFRIAHGSRFNWKGVEGKTTDGAMAFRHDNKALVVYFDGHVGAVTMGDLKEIDKNQGGSKSVFWRPNQN